MTVTWYISVEAQVRTGNQESKIDMNRIVVKNTDLLVLLDDNVTARRKLLDRLITPLLAKVAEGTDE